ncbi:hypothetical protein TSUD_31060 [Trifolium subterraneum]|uniref:Aminotransferase-like plant mobile domain-containing protein n=1 Tax=Trifolium subterraneum TaxID=3900 RepID=A0A2Z6MKQ8_TRISU|nr:hypothetical protein TSUD_31060 [Trifolium subterraneum]
MADEVGRQRGGRESRAHSSARQEATLGLSKRKVVVASTSGAQLQEPEAEHPEPQPMAEEEAPKQTKRNRRTTSSRNPPKPAEPQVTEFGGGPSDLSLLPSFGGHVAAALWRGERARSPLIRCDFANGLFLSDFVCCIFADASLQRMLQKFCGQRTLKCMNPGKRINSLDKPENDNAWFWDRVEASGLRPLLKTNYTHVGSGLLTAFTERWQPETGTFHLPIGEMTITLDDVSCLLHIPISGKMLNHAGTSCTMEEGQDMCEELLNFSREDAQEEFDKIKGAHVSFAKLLEIYHDNLNSALEAENNEDEEEGTVEFLTDCTAWVFAHFKRYGQRFLDENYTNEEPVGAKYYPLKTGKWPYETRTSLDRMEVDEVTFCPYEDHRQTRPFQDISWYSGWIMCGSSMICPHLPERILRQYGHVQSIPRASGVSAKAGMNQFSIQDAFDEYLNENYVTEEMRGLRAVHGYETVSGYIAWFYRVSHPKIWPRVGGDPPRPANVEVMIEEDNANKKCYVFEICKTVHEQCHILNIFDNTTRDSISRQITNSSSLPLALTVMLAS